MRALWLVALILTLILLVAGCGLLQTVSDMRPGTGSEDEPETVVDRRELIAEKASMSVTCENNCSEVNAHTSFSPASFSFSVERLPDLVLAYVWDFGDGNTANGPSATHTYATPGEYTVELCLVPKGASNEDEAVSLTQFIVVERQALSNRTLDYFRYEHSWVIFERWIYVNWASSTPQYIIKVQFTLKVDMWLVEWEDHWPDGAISDEGAGRNFTAGTFNLPDYAMEEDSEIEFDPYFVNARTSEDIQILGRARFCRAIDNCDVFDVEPRHIDTDGIF